MSKNKVIRTFKFENEDFTLVSPSVMVLREAKYKYSRTFTEALNNGFYTRKRLEGVLSSGENNILKAHTEKRTELLKAFAETQQALDSATDPSEIEYQAGLLSLFRDQMVQEDISINTIFSITAEQMAEDDRIAFLTFHMTRKADGSPVWASTEEFMEDTRFSFVEVCKYQVICWEFNLNPDWEEKLPENIAIKKAEKLRSDALKDEEVSKAVAPEKKEKKTTTKKPRKSKKVEDKQEETSVEAR